MLDGFGQGQILFADRGAPRRRRRLRQHQADAQPGGCPSFSLYLYRFRNLGGDNAWLIIDDTALPKKGETSVGVAPQYASALGKTANCQSLVSLTLASREVPVMVGLRLFLPEKWTRDPERMARVRVLQERRTALTKPEIAIREIDRVMASGARFGCVLADSGYGPAGLSVRL